MHLQTQSCHHPLCCNSASQVSQSSEQEKLIMVTGGDEKLLQGRVVTADCGSVHRVVCQEIATCVQTRC